MDIIYRIFDLVITIRDTRWLLCCVAKTTRRELVENNYIRSRGKPKRFTNVLLRCKEIKFGSITQPWGRSLLRGLLQTWRNSKVLFAKKWKKLWEDSKSFFYIVSAQVVGKRGEGEVRANEVSGPHKACSHSSPFDVYIQRKEKLAPLNCVEQWGVVCAETLRALVRSSLGLSFRSLELWRCRFNHPTFRILVQLFKI